MKRLFTFLATSFLFHTVVNGQLLKEPSFDTLIVERFQVNPTSGMLTAPSGNDQQWINFDGDGIPPLCFDGPSNENAWYWESDLGGNNPDNFAFTSCSYFDGDESLSYPCSNWLILSPVFIPDSFCILQWKSLTFSGPAFMDGYKVLVSDSENDPSPEIFTDTLFSAASMIGCSPASNDCATLNLSHYSFTPGYIHANNFTDDDYFFQEYLGGGIYSYRGLFEPHEVSLAAYAGKTIYLAFLHDSNNNFMLQIDDILVVDQETSGTLDRSNAVLDFTVAPNPIRSEATIKWSLNQALETRLEIRDVSGRLMHSTLLPEMQSNQYRLNMENWSTGTYIATLLTDQGVGYQKLMKR